MCAVHEVYRTDHAKECPKVVPPPALTHEHDHERDEHAYGNDFLNYLELGNIESGRCANSVCRNGDHVFGERNEPAYEYDCD